MRLWTEAVTDRSRHDIISGTPKAYLHAADMNRIESNIAYLSERLSRQGYRIQAAEPTVWSRDGVPRVADIVYISGSIQAITRAYYEPDGYTDISDLPGKALDYTDINNVERNLAGIKALIDQGLRYSYLTHFTYGQLSGYTNAELRKGLVDFPTINDDGVSGIINYIDIRIPRQLQEEAIKQIKMRNEK